MDESQSSELKRGTCPYCGTENPTSAAFCKKCGRRLDGMGVCPHCGQLTPADGEFCINCGANRNAPVLEKKVFAKPRPTNTQAPAVSNGTEAVSSPRVVTPSTRASGKVTRILGFISFGSSCLTVVLSVVFSLLVGAVVSAAGVDVPGLADLNLFTYFGDAYKSLDGSDIAAYGIAGPLLGTVGIVIGLVLLVVVLVFAIRALIKTIQSNEWNLTKYGVLSYFVYLSIISVFMLNAASSATMLGVTASYSLNGATVAGIILGAIFMLISVVLDAIVNRVVGGLRSYLIQGISTGVTMILGILVLSFIGYGLFTVSVSASGMSSSTTYGIKSFSDFLFKTVNSLYYTATTEVWEEFLPYFAASFVYMIMAFVFAGAFLVFFVLTIKDSLSSFGYGVTKNTTKFGILAGVMAILLGVVQVVFPLIVAPYFFTSADVELVLPIMTIILGGIILAGSLVTSLLLKKSGDVVAE